nr:MAG TPA: hypothetical protein [Caudoviricetes sp.]DAT25010.1 MAG TPA: hypothetical protein [Caudoviricetes sp.]DAT83351.1 MAG TPA: hypothetical protein [Caudoviricetes sp.]
MRCVVENDKNDSENVNEFINFEIETPRFQFI